MDMHELQVSDQISIDLHSSICIKESSVAVYLLVHEPNPPRPPP